MSDLHQAYSDWHGCFFQVHADQCAVEMIEKGAGIYVNLTGMMVTGFGYHYKQEGLSSNPVVTPDFFVEYSSLHFYPPAGGVKKS
jgi:hypothetical protein